MFHNFRAEALRCSQSRCQRYSSHMKVRLLTTTTQRQGPFRMAVIGSGPAGFYTSHKVMQRIPEARVDMYEQLPVPFGLVRFGVAPDHPEVKNCEAKFAEVASSPRFGFFGNVEIGTSLQLSSLRQNYDAILFAYGASIDRSLGIPGEELEGVYSARAFVGWYNGLPEFENLDPDLESSDTAVVIGQGNVALDVARILLSDVARLRATDISEAAIETLAKSRVKHVRVVGRRGPMQAAFTIKEVRELLQLPSVRFEPITSDLLPSNDSDLPRASRRVAQLLSKHSLAKQDSQALKSFTLDFLLSPRRFNAQGHPSRLSGIEFGQCVYADESHKLRKDARVVSAEGTRTIHTGLSFRSIGYKAEPLPGMEDLGIDFDERVGRVLNDGGRVLCNGKIGRGLYCAGWAKSGPTGVIATTMEDSFATAEVIAQDWDGQTSYCGGSDAIENLIHNRVDWRGWQRIDKAERELGEKRGKEREKLRSVQEMLAIA